jgi:hypothetical protein
LIWIVSLEKRGRWIARKEAHVLIRVSPELRSELAKCATLAPCPDTTAKFDILLKNPSMRSDTEIRADARIARSNVYQGYVGPMFRHEDHPFRHRCGIRPNDGTRGCRAACASPRELADHEM